MIFLWCFLVDFLLIIINFDEYYVNKMLKMIFFCCLLFNLLNFFFDKGI